MRQNKITAYLKKLKYLLRSKDKPIDHRRAYWDELIAWEPDYWHRAVKLTQSGQRVLIATSMGGYEHGALLESSLAVALTLRGASVDILLCDSFLPGCQITKIVNATPEDMMEGPPLPRCSECQARGAKAFSSLGLPIHWYSQFVSPEEAKWARRISNRIPFDEIQYYKIDDLAVGEHAYAGALRYYARGDLEGEPERDMILRRFLEAAILTVSVVENLLARRKYDIVCLNHGLYVPQGLIVEVFRKRDLRVVTWNPAYRKPCFIFSHGETYHHTMMNEPISAWENIQWTGELERKTLEYLDSRRNGSKDWIWFHNKPDESLDLLVQEIGVNLNRPIIGLLTSVMWDAQLHYTSNAFDNMLQWVQETVNYFSKKKDIQLVIRVHPAEIHGQNVSRQRIVDEIRKFCPELPDNIYVIPPESTISTYTLVEQCKAVLIYNTKTGIEISSIGIPVVVAGEAWIRNKGFSLDATNQDEYFEILDRLATIGGMDTEQVERARRYAFHFFFRRMVPLPFIDDSAGYGLRLQVSSLQTLAPNNYRGLDLICDGILKGTPFIDQLERDEHELLSSFDSPLNSP